MKNVSKKLLVAALASLTVSCSGTKIVVKDYLFYGDKGKFGATMVHSLHPELPGVKIPKLEWDERRIGMICTDGDNIADIMANVDKLCAKNKTACIYAKELVTELKQVLLSIDRATK